MYAPDAASRRQLVRAAARRRKTERVEREESLRDRTGIRTLRRQPVFTSPNVFPPVSPDAFAPEDVQAADAPREPLEEQHCYVCKTHFTALHHFYDQLCPPCAEFNFAKRTELADLRGTVALLTGGRVKIGYQAGLKLLRVAAHGSSSPPASPATPPPATRASRTSPSGGTGSRSSASTSATRRASRRSATSWWRRASGSTSSSTTPARPSGARRPSTPT